MCEISSCGSLEKGSNVMVASNSVEIEKRDSAFDSGSNLRRKVCKPLIVGDDDNCLRTKSNSRAFNFGSKRALMGEAVDVADLPFHPCSEFIV